MSTPQEDRTVSSLLVFSIGLIGVCAFLQVYSVQAILPLLLDSFRATPVQVGNTVGATVLAVALISPFIGMWSDTVGRKAIIVGAIAFLAIPTALIAFSSSIQQMTFWRFVQGLAIPGITVVTIAYIGEEFKGKSMTRLMSAYVAGTVLGGFLGRFILGHLVEWMSWQSAFGVMSTLTVAGAVLVAKVLPPSTHFEPTHQLRDSLGILAQHIRHPAILTACAVGFCVLFSLVGCFTYINLHLADVPYQLSSSQLANIFSVYLLGVIITPIAGKIIPILGTRRTILLALSLSASGLLLTLVQPLWLIIVALTVMSSGVFITQSATISFIAQRVQQGRSLASGLYYMAYYAGGSVGALVCGMAFSYGNWPVTVATIFVAQIAAMGLVFAFIPPLARATVVRAR